MKIRNYLTILFATIAIICLLGLAGFIALYTADGSNPYRQEMLRILSPYFKEDSLSTPVSQSHAEPDTEKKVSEHSFVFVGDSRTIGMQHAVADNCTYIGAEGEGYHWFSKDGILALSDTLGANPEETVILNLGVNDPENINVYIDLYQKLVQDYPNAAFYMLSVNPLDDDADFNTTNAMIELFNATMESAFPGHCLDSYSYLCENGYETVDGLHYTDATYRRIHDFVVEHSTE